MGFFDINKKQTRKIEIKHHYDMYYYIEEEEFIGSIDEEMRKLETKLKGKKAGDFVRLGNLIVDVDNIKWIKVV